MQRSVSPPKPTITGEEFKRRYDAGERAFRNMFIADLLEGSHLVGTNFDGVEITGHLFRVVIERCNFVNARFWHGKWQELQLEKCSFRSTRFTRIAMERCGFRSCHFSGCHVTDI